jgi:hypothetical protein
MNRFVTKAELALLAASCAAFFLPTAPAQTDELARRIAAALLPLPESMRADATVVSRGEDGKVSVLRKGSGEMVCTADQPGNQVFYVNCFHQAIYDARNRAEEVTKELQRANKPADRNAVFAVIDKEIKDGKLKLPDHPVMGFQMRGPRSGYNPATNTVSSEITVWQMVEIPYTTGAKLSLPEEPKGTVPWVMFPGTWDAHIMIEH